MYKRETKKFSSYNVLNNVTVYWHTSESVLVVLESVSFLSPSDRRVQSHFSRESRDVLNARHSSADPEHETCFCKLNNFLIKA